MTPDQVPEVPQEMMSLGMYALVMQGAQFFEYKLAILCTWVELDLSPRRRPKDLEKGMRPLLKKIEHAFQNASASELRNRLRGNVDAELLEEVSVLIDFRNRLAHRYLREQFVLSPPIFGESMFDEMTSAVARFEQVHKRIDDETERIVAMKASATSEPPPQLEELARRLMYGDVD